MGFEQQPYIYPQSLPYSSFDPKAVTRASWTPKPQYVPPTGPLLDFNRHPDSYLIAPKPSTYTVHFGDTAKRSIIGLRWVQLALRIFGELGSIGLLVCVVCFKNMQASDDYIIRVPPAADILFCFYGIYHLMRKANGRTAGSSASYHFFAMVLDLGFIPFFVFIFLKARTIMVLPVGTQFRWTSLFQTTLQTDQVLFATWIISIALAGLHFGSFAISIYLWWMFRKIDNMPPDVNPLEDNLTSKRKTKHKYKNSDAFVAEKEKRDSAMSLGLDGRRLPAKERPVSFFSTRNESSERFSPHNPRTAHMSREDLEIPYPSIYLRDSAHHGSSRSLASAPPAYTRPTSRSKLAHSFAAEEEEAERLPTMKSGSSVYTDASYGQATDFNKGETPKIPRKSSKRVATSEGNWMVLGPEEQNDSDSENHHPAISVIEEDSEGEQSFTRGDDSHQQPSRLNVFNRGATYQPLANRSNEATPTFKTDDGDLGTQRFRDVSLSPPMPMPKRPQERAQIVRSALLDPNKELSPLNMNPPSPQPSSYYSTRNSKSTLISDTSKSSLVTHARSVRKNENVKPASVAGAYTTNEAPSDPPERGSGSPKGKYYGDLRSAMQGIRSGTSSPSRQGPATGSPARSSRSPYQVQYDSSATKAAPWMSSSDSPSPKKSQVAKTVGSQWPLRESAESLLPNESSDKERDGGVGGRVVSRSGVDLVDAPLVDYQPSELSAHHVNGYGGNGRRLVSGKAAEEGLAGGATGWWSGARRRVSGKGF